MIRALFRLAGRFALLLATMAFLVGVSIFIVGSYILTWPILRLSPRDKKLRATTDFVAAGMTLLTAFSDSHIKAMVTEALDESDPDDAEPDVRYPYFDGNSIVLGPECFVADDGSVLVWRGEQYIPVNLDTSARKVEGEKLTD